MQPTFPISLVDGETFCESLAGIPHGSYLTSVNPLCMGHPMSRPIVRGRFDNQASSLYSHLLDDPLPNLELIRLAHTMADNLGEPNCYSSSSEERQRIVIDPTR